MDSGQKRQTKHDMSEERTEDTVSGNTFKWKLQKAIWQQV